MKTYIRWKQTQFFKIKMLLKVYDFFISWLVVLLIENLKMLWLNNNLFQLKSDAILQSNQFTVHTFIWNLQVEQLCQTFNMSHRYKRGVEIPAQQLLRGLVKQDSLSFIERKSSTFGPPQNI